MDNFIILDIINDMVLVENTTINDNCFNCGLESESCEKLCHNTKYNKAYFLSNKSIKDLLTGRARVYEIDEKLRHKFVDFMDKYYENIHYEIIDINEQGILIWNQNEQNNNTSSLHKSCFRCKFDHNTCNLECLPVLNRQKVDKEQYIKKCNRYYLSDLEENKLIDGVRCTYEFNYLTPKKGLLMLTSYIHDKYIEKGMTGENGPDDSNLKAQSGPAGVNDMTTNSKGKTGSSGSWHRELCEKGAKWLKKHHENVTVPNCSIVCVELSSPVTKEIPDVIGWCSWCSVMLEIKVSRFDFIKDKNKFARSEEQGVGEFRYYLCPKNLIKPEELPENYGLLYDSEEGIQIVKVATRQSTNLTAERNMLTTLVRYKSKS